MTENEVVPTPDISEPESYHPNIKKCATVVSQQVCIQADVKIDPSVHVGDIRMFCQDPIIGKCSRITCGHDPCQFIVSQTICVQIPLEFCVATRVDPAGHICAPPDIAPCPRCPEDPR